MSITIKEKMKKIKIVTEIQIVKEAGKIFKMDNLYQHILLKKNNFEAKQKTLFLNKSKKYLNLKKTTFTFN